MITLPESAGDPRDRVLLYLTAHGPTRVDRQGRKHLARALCLRVDFLLELSLFDLRRRRLLTFDGDLVAVVSLRRAAAG
jgi:hypothetical protein